MKTRFTLLCIFLLMMSFISLEAQQRTTMDVALINGMQARMDFDDDAKEITLTWVGPSDRWFALQFGSFTRGMANGTDVIYYDGAFKDAHQLGIGATPAQDANDWTVVSNEEDVPSAGLRTIVATRAYDTDDSDDHEFFIGETSVDFAYANGRESSFVFVNHGSANRGLRLDNPITVISSTQEVEASPITVSPNPATDEIRIKSELQMKAIALYDAVGRQVLMQVNPRNAIDVSSQERGVYFLEMRTTDEQFFYRKIVLQ